ncbi:MAG TPA: winged helix-turn-helix transcriptional regulator, partial [Actinomadura sp.]|nr:winged helix-turn-helix transcriptional regulator [Actinomadura sp.]
RRTRREYRLTAKGWDLYPALIALMQWGDKYTADPDGLPVEVRHRGCGAPVEAVVRCSRENLTLSPRQAEVRPGPAARPATAGLSASGASSGPKSDPRAGARGLD